MDPLQRLVAVVNQSGLKRARIAEEAGMSPTKLSKILSGSQVVTMPDYLAIAKAVHCEPARLFTEGEIVIELTALEELWGLCQSMSEIIGRWRPAGSATATNVLRQVKVPSSRWIEPVRAAANPNAEMVAELESERKFIPRRAWNRGARMIARVVGDSMDGGDEPLRDGELAYLKPTNSPRSANGRVTLVHYEDGLYLKTLKVTGEHTSLLSAGKGYAEIDLDPHAANVQIYGYVVDHGSGK